MFLEIDGGYSGIRFSACHFIPRHEKCSRLHGHSYIVRLRLEGDIGEDGMITSINGIENPADYSSCWMLYTSDAENSNAAWGTVEYQGKQYASAVSGAETLKIKPDQLYIWVYKSFS